MRLKVIACKVMLREFYSLAAKTKNIVDIRWMKQELHTQPGSLQVSLQRVIDETEAEARDYDAICFGYGLCSNGIVGLKSRYTRLVIPRAHDCITLLLGSRKTYKDMFEEGSGGTYWLSRGWMETGVVPGKKSNEVKYNEYKEKYGEDNANYLLNLEQNWLNDYNKATFIRWPDMETGDFESQACKTAYENSWDYQLVDGKDTLLRHMLDGDWNNDEFLVVPPGKTVKPSFTEGLITV